MTDAAILVPVLRRPHRVAALVESALATGELRLVFLCSPGDDAEHDAVRACGLDPVVVDWPAGPGDYARKINAGVALTDEPLLLFAADDITFRPGWLEHAAQLMTGRIGVVGTNDLGNGAVMRGKHATHPLVARWYAEHPTVDGTAGPLHERYDHNFVDNEFVQVAQARRAWAFAHDSVVEHLHPSWSKGEWDATYERGRSGWDHDRRLFRDRRRRLWMQKRLAVAVPA